MSTFLSFIGSGGTLNVNANVNSPAELRVQDAGSTLNLNAGTFTAATLSILPAAWSTAPAGRIPSPIWPSRAALHCLIREATILPRPLTLTSGSSFTLQKNLALTGILNVTGSTLNLGGRQATVGTLDLSGAAVVDRGMGGGVQGQSLSVAAGASYVIEGSDNFTNSISVATGGTAANNIAQTLSGTLSIPALAPLHSRRSAVAEHVP